jgi:Predicted membrane protein
MPATNSRGLRPISIARRPLTAMLLPVPIVCFIGVLLTDLSYLDSGGNLVWLDFSSWLNAAGLLFGAIAAVVLFIDTIRSSVGWGTFLLLAAAWVVEFINALVHARDGWTAVAGAGLILSIVGVLVILVSGWLWQEIRYRNEGARP